MVLHNTCCGAALKRGFILGEICMSSASGIRDLCRPRAGAYLGGMLLCVFLGACSGTTGPAGPAGAAGASGSPGPSTTGAALNVSTHSTRTTRNEMRERFLPSLRVVAAQVSASLA